MKNSSIKKLVNASLLLAIGMILPFFTGQIPAIGNMLLPMHIPVLLCGFACGTGYGLLTGALLPVVRSMIFGMPILFPNGLAMAVELAVYGAVTGLLGKRLRRSYKHIYLALIIAMLCGRIAWGVASVVLYSIAGSGFTWKVFVAQGFANGIPGVLIQLILIPAIVKRMPKDGLIALRSSCMKRFAPAVKQIRALAKDKSKNTIIVAIDGMCASGKSTLGSYLQNEFDANLFHMDDFFLQKHQRTEERLAEVGGNVDYERFKEEVLEPILGGKEVSYRRFDCGVLEIAESQIIAPKRINIIEGSYSHHPYFENPYDLRIFTEITEEKQLANIRVRNGEEKLQTFIERWIPKEEAYFERYKIREKSDMIIPWIKK